jgi:hypothetical protein
LGYLNERALDFACLPAAAAWISSLSRLITPLATTLPFKAAVRVDVLTSSSAICKGNGNGPGIDAE